MCFSASASFGAGAVILGIGIISIIKTKTVAHRTFALIPLFFAVQQFTEGFLWLVLSNPGYDNWRPLLIHLYLTFAWIIWPVFIPFSIGLLEIKPNRKKLLHFFLVIGAIVSSGFLYVMASHNVHAFINEYHIDYKFDYKPVYPILFSALYLIATVISLFASSIKNMWIFGAVNLASYLFSRIFFYGHVISIWCFFGALSSIIVLWIILDKKSLHINKNLFLKYL